MPLEEQVVHTSIKDIDGPTGSCWLSWVLMKPFFTVIICVYNRAELLPRAFDSLLAQNESDWEAVVVDDASTDGSVEVVQNYASKDRRIRLVTRSENGGTSAARNTGIDAAKGLFVTFLDSDDEYEPDHLWSRRQMLIENDPVVFLHGGLRIVGDPWVPDRLDSSKKIHIDNCVVGGTFVIRRDVLDSLGGFDDVDYGDDAMFYDRATKAGVTIAQTEHPSYVYYRDTPNQATSTHGT